MIIRTFDASDRDAVIALWRDVFPEYADASRPQRDPALIYREQDGDAAGVVLRREIEDG